MVRAVGLPGLAFLAEADFAVGLDRQVRGGAWGLLGWEGAVAAVVRGAPRRGEDGGGVGPVEEGIEED